MIDTKPLMAQLPRAILETAPDDIRSRLNGADKSDMLDPSYPYAAQMDRISTRRRWPRCRELAKFHAWVRDR